MRIVIFLTLLFSFIKANTLDTNILYLEQKIETPPVLSNVIDEPKDSGLKGIELAIKDSNKTARFLGQNYNLQKIISKNEEEIISSLEKFINEKNTFVILNVQNDLFKKIVNHPMAEKILILNSANPNSEFRKTICKPNVLHTISSNAMLYDGLVQFMIKRNWKEWLLIKGDNEKDKEIEKAIKRSAKRFGGKIVDEKVWTSTSDIRRKAQSEMPAFTQGDDYDVVLLADHYGNFGEYVYFNSWLPRPVAGTQGLTPVTWHKVIEAWGAAQLQKRFEKKSKRWMNSIDYASWLAVRTIVTSVTKTKTNDLKTNVEFIRSKDFELGAYKGRKLSFREFNGQLRQPVPLIHPRALVSTSPQVGFLHPITDLDTLGIAKHELKCQ